MTIEDIIALLSLAALEIVLGIDNIVFLAVITSRLPEASRPKIRRIGLALAMFMRIALLLVISWVVALKDPLLHMFSRDFSGRDLIMLGGGLFLMAKATYEIHHSVEGPGNDPKVGNGAGPSVWAVLLQVVLIDVIFSLDSVITAVGMVGSIPIMIAAVVLSVGVMMLFANPVSTFIMKHPTVKMLALSFLLLIGFVLVADGFGKHIEKGYIYFAMGFSLAVEALNFRVRPKPSREPNS